MEKLLNNLVDRLKLAAGSNLRSVVLYGSAAASQYHPKHSDLNVLVVVNTLDAAELHALAPVSRWWESRGQPGPMIFTEEELRRSADMFAIELLDIKTTGRVLWGEDVLAEIDVPMQLHRIQVERELAQALVRFRQHYMAGGGSRRVERKLLLASVSTFAVLFRHALLALGEPMARDRRQAIDRVAAIAGFDAGPFHALLDVREAKRKAGELDWHGIFSGYLKAIERVAQEVDRRLAETAKPAVN
jgi:predicted nucleotidyltransferase